jgi:hypothetical protein
MATTTVNRDEKVIVKLSPVIKAKLQAHCEVLGVSMSGFVAVLIGQTLKQTTTAEDAMKSIIEQIGMEGMANLSDMVKAGQQSVSEA